MIQSEQKYFNYIDIDCATSLFGGETQAYHIDEVEKNHASSPPPTPTPPLQEGLPSDRSAVCLYKA